jgi:NAD+ kinase
VTRVGFIVHGGREDARAAAVAAVRRIREIGAEPVGCSDDEWPPDVAVELRAPAAFAVDLDVVLVFGGDGTFLRSAYLARDAGVPLLGVNLGRLGFLSELEREAKPEALERVVAGDYTVEERMTLAVSVRDVDGVEVGSSWALNEASVERVVPQRLVVIEVRVGETVFANIPADAMICATPTGSTAYAFSARGPILSPLVDAILLVPVAPHSLFDRTLVIDPRESLSLRPIAVDNPCVVSLDGRESLGVPSGGSVTVARGERPVRMARLAQFDFYRRVREKFGLQ